jgi:hypothetical protein
MKEAPLTSVIGFLIEALGLNRSRYESGVIDISPVIISPDFIGPIMPPNDQSSGQGIGQGFGSGINDDNPFGNWDGNNNAAQTSLGSAGSDMNNNGIPDDIDALLGGR